MFRLPEWRHDGLKNVGTRRLARKEIPLKNNVTDEIRLRGCLVDRRTQKGNAMNFRTLKVGAADSQRLVFSSQQSAVGFSNFLDEERMMLKFASERKNAPQHWV
ncbi:MAG: hypothetical protein ABSF60_02140 [Verrucomicrobiota bacterium]